MDNRKQQTIKTNTNNKDYFIPTIGHCPKDNGLIALEKCSDGFFQSGKESVLGIYSTMDGKVEFICFENRTLAYVKSSMGYPAYYPLKEIKIERPIQAVLMDLDGTTVHSENFWMWIIQLTVASLLDNKNFELEDEDIPFVSGHSVSEHLQYCIGKYCPDKTVEQARSFYVEHIRRQMQAILEGTGRMDAFTPSPGIKEFLLQLKALNIKIGLVTSGLYEKAYPEILSAFRQLNMGNPEDFYDAIITAGFLVGKGQVGTLGELSPKPHPWLYAEAARVGLGIQVCDRHHVVGIEDSGAGICAIRLAGFAPIGIAGGNITQSGTGCLCKQQFQSLSEILDFLK